MAKSADLEIDAERLRGQLVAQIKDVRERLTPSQVFATAKEEVVQATAPIRSRVGDAAKTYGGAFSLIGAAVGLASLPRKKAVPAAPKSDARAPPMSGGRALTLVGAGAALGAVVAAAIPSASIEQNFFRAARKDINDVFTKQSTRHINSILSGETKRASAIKLGLAALTVMLQASSSKTKSAES